LVVGRLMYSSVISNLSSMSDWYVRVFAKKTNNYPHLDEID